MARTYKTLSLSLPPGVFEELAAIGKTTGRTGARVAAEIVLREIATTPKTKKKAKEKTKEKTCHKSWCCGARVVPIQGPLVIIDKKYDMSRAWVPVIALLCASCKKQMHGREYEGWIADA